MDHRRNHSDSAFANADFWRAKLPEICTLNFCSLGQPAAQTHEHNSNTSDYAPSYNWTIRLVCGVRIRFCMGSAEGSWQAGSTCMFDAAQVANSFHNKRHIACLGGGGVKEGRAIAQVAFDILQLQILTLKIEGLAYYGMDAHTQHTRSPRPVMKPTPFGAHLVRWLCNQKRWSATASMTSPFTLGVLLICRHIICSHAIDPITSNWVATLHCLCCWHFR